MKQKKEHEIGAAAIAAAMQEAAEATPAEDTPVETSPAEVTPTEEAVPPTDETTPLPLAAAWGKFLASLAPKERDTVLAVLSRLAAREAARREAEEEQTVLTEMEGMPAFAGILARRGELRELIGKIGWLRALPIRDRLAAACYLDRGMRLHEPTREEKLEAILSDPALMRALAEKQAAARGARRGALAPAARTGGRMPANLPKPPKDLHEAGLAAKQFFNI